jgi:curved DNA-binding protein CbpA
MSNSKNLSKAELLKLFNLPKVYTLDELKKSYKALLVKYHPDKSKKIESTDVFTFITHCFQILYEELKRQVLDKDHLTLQSEFKQEKSTFTYSPQNSKFDNQKFNELFDKFKVATDDKGHGNWLKSDEKPTHTDKKVVVYKEPTPLVSSIGKYNFEELGKKNKGEFNDVMTNKIKSISFMDLKTAHSTTELIDPSSNINRKEYKNVDELERDRANVSFTMNDEELHQYLQLQEKKKRAEVKRLQILEQNDRTIEENFKKVNPLLLSQFGRS